MKKFYAALSMLFLAGSAFAQLTQANHAPAPGDAYQMWDCSNSTVTPGSAGAGVVWDFSSMVTSSNVIVSFSASTSTNTTYPSANVALKSAANSNSYLASSTGALLYYGGDIAVSSVTGSLTYTAPAVMASYPMSLNTTSSSVTGGSLAVTNPFPTSGTFIGNSSVTADGTGTLILPGGGTYSNVIRVTTSQTISISSIVSGTITQTVRSYYASGIKAPVVTYGVTDTQIGSANSQTVIMRSTTALGNSPTSTVTTSTPAHSAEQLSLFPNPANDRVSVSGANGASHLQLFDLTGKQVSRISVSNGAATIDTSALPAGVYLFTLHDGKGEIVDTGRLAVTH